MDKQKLIQKWLNNELTADEQIAFDAMEDATFLQEIASEAKRFGRARSAPSFESMEGRLMPKSEKKTNWLSLVSKVAAVFIIGLGLYYVFNTNDEVNFKTQLAENQNVTLPDSSKVTLNDFSSLAYDAKKWNEKRTLTLDGEAFFDVEKGKRFDVNTSYGTVSVLGTEFNVTARDSIFQVVCYEGLVQVAYKGQTVKLPAGKVFIFMDGKTKIQEVAVRKPQWLNQLSVFENAPLAAVIAELEKQYEIAITNETTNDILFTGAFENNNLENALTAITRALGLTYEIKDNDQIFIRHEEH